MQERIGHEGEETLHSKSAAPPVAKGYYLRVLEPTNAAAGLRNMREMQTLCHVLDHLAMGRVAQASDMVFQRLKAIEKSVREGNWERAKFVELLMDEKVVSSRLIVCSPFPNAFC